MTHKILPIMVFITIVLSGCKSLMNNNEATVFEINPRIIEGKLELCKQSLIQDLEEQNPAWPTKQMRKVHAMSAMNFLSIIQTYSDKMQDQFLSACINDQRNMKVPRKPALEPAPESMDL